MKRFQIVFIGLFLALAIVTGGYAQQANLKDELDSFRDSVEKINDIVNGGETEYVSTEGGNVKTVAHAIKDLMAFNPRGAWATSTSYAVKDLVTESGDIYVCVEAHTSGTFSTDQSAGYWAYYQTFDNSTYVDSLADLQNVQVGQADTVHMSYRSSFGDGGGGVFVWDPTDHSTATGTGYVDDDSLHGIYVPPNSDTTGASGAWVRFYTSGEAFPEWFTTNATPGTTDMTDAIISCLDLVGTAMLGDSTYFVIPGEIALDEAGQAIIGPAINEGSGKRGACILGDYSVTGEPIITVGHHYNRIENLRLSFDSLPPNTDTLAFAIAFDDTTTNPAWGTFRNIHIDTVYGGFGELSGFTGYAFNCVYENVFIRNWTGWAMYRTTADSGAIYTNLYINNSWSGVQDAIGFIYSAGGAQAVFNMLNVEYCNVSSETPLYFDRCDLVMNMLHFEGVTFDHATPTAVYCGGPAAFYVFNDATFGFVEADSTQSSFSLFRITEEKTKVVVNGVNIATHCDFSGVTGDVSWVVIDSTIDRETTEFWLKGGYDNSGDINEMWTASSSADKWVVKQINRLVYPERDYYTGALADDSADSFTPFINEGMMYIAVDGDGDLSGVVLYRADSLGSYCTLVGAGGDLEVTTGALAGTTGTDDKVTISAHTDGNIYIENRAGKTLYVHFLRIANVG